MIMIANLYLYNLYRQFEDTSCVSFLKKYIGSFSKHLKSVRFGTFAVIARVSGIHPVMGRTVFGTNTRKWPEGITLERTCTSGSDVTERTSRKRAFEKDLW
jgi:hypothetical protein